MYYEKRFLTSSLANSHLKSSQVLVCFTLICRKYLCLELSSKLLQLTALCGCAKASLSGKAPEHRWDYYFLTWAQNKMEKKGLFPNLAILFKIILWFFSWLFVRLAALMVPKSVTGRKMAWGLPSSALKGTQELLLTQLVDGIKERLIWSRWSFYAFLQRQVDFHSRILTSGKSHEDSKSLRVERTHTAL